eukprot:234653-Hanusia_phi.AAC.1
MMFVRTKALSEGKLPQREALVKLKQCWREEERLEVEIDRSPPSSRQRERCDGVVRVVLDRRVVRHELRFLGETAKDSGRRLNAAKEGAGRDRKLQPEGCAGPS